MEGFLVIIVFAAIALISAAAKSKGRNSGRNANGDPPPRPAVPLSDIQKAFMMTQENAQQPPRQTAPRPVYTPPYGQPPQAAPRPPYTPPSQVRPAYAPAQPTAYAPMQARNAEPMQARTTTSMQARTVEPMQARTAAAVPPHPMYAASGAPMPPQNIYGGSMNAVTREGIRDEEGDDTPLQVVRSSAAESVADVNLESITDTDSPVLSVRKQPESTARKGMPLGLFADRNELVKAVIYAEILTPKSSGAPRA